jgi:hypothetical protein
VTTVGAPAAVLLPLHGVVGDPDTAGAVGHLDRLHDVAPHHHQLEERHRRGAVHGAVGHAHRVEEALGRAESLLHARRHQGEGAGRVVAPEGVDLAVDNSADLRHVRRCNPAVGGRSGAERQEDGEGKEQSPEH